MINNILPNILLTGFIEMLQNVQTKTSLIFFLPILVGVIAFHIGSKNSTSNGLTMAGVAALTLSLLFFQLDETAMLYTGMVGTFLVIIGLSTLLFTNYSRK